MLAKQYRHIENVIRLLSNPSAMQMDPVIAASWRRSVLQYGHNPEKPQAVKILTPSAFQLFRDPYDEFIAIINHGLKALYCQIKDMGYVVLLTDNHGVVVQEHGAKRQAKALLSAGLCQSAYWHEAENGTSAVGLALATGTALTVHQVEHFDATHISLTCSAAPIFDSQGVLYAILNVSALRSDCAKTSQFLVLQTVCRYARLIENASFIHAHRHHWQIRLGAAAQFLGVDPEFLLAVDDNGHIRGANQCWRRWLSERALLPPGGLNGLPVAQLLGWDLNQLVCQYGASDHYRQSLVVGGAVLYAHILPPPLQRVQKSAPVPPLPPALDKLCAPNSRFRSQLQKIVHLADTPIPILLNGETGSGKEILAKAIHHSSNRQQHAFVAVNCAAIAENLIESELYGYAPGSFSGALGNGKRGLIQAADGGTLFLDEIGDMPLFLQSRLLRVLSEREVLPVGSTRAVKVDIRIIAATHCDLQQKIAAGKFREDLYYRLNGLHFVIPPLRERDDLPYLTQLILQQCAQQLNVPAKPLSAEALLLLQNQNWPGNVRQLKSVLEVALLMANGPRIESADLPEEWQHLTVLARVPAATPDNVRQILADAALLEQMLQQHHWSVTALATAVGVSRMTLYRYINKHGLRKPS